MALTKADLASIGAVVAAAFEAALTNTLAAAQPVVSAPTATPKASQKTWATKAERAAGGGFACACGRTGLRTAPHKGSFHKAPDGTTHTV